MSWIYRVGLAESEVGEEVLKRAGLTYTQVKVEDALRAHIPETLDKPYKFYTSMRADAPNLFSCSSLISYLYTFAGVWMPSVVIDKYFFAQPVKKGDLQFGDLIFVSSKPDDSYPQRTTTLEFEPGQHTAPRPVTHVMMYMGNNEFLHASPLSQRGKVVIENFGSLDEASIVGFGRVANMSDRRWVVEIPDDRADIRSHDSLLEYLKGV